MYTIEATAFLRHMVRNIVGTLVEVGDGVRDMPSCCGCVIDRGRRYRTGTRAVPDASEY
jgi:tRNA pseudouridine38-40 synthase